MEIKMKIYDISQELLSCVVFPGDPAPKKDKLSSLSEGGICNLTSLFMCAHNGTHVDAPYHFINDGKTIDEIELSQVVGMAYVADIQGVITANDASTVLERAKKISPEAAKRILLKGDVTVSLEAAKVFAADGVCLVGNESQTVGPETAPIPVHHVLLGAGVVLLEGVRLKEVEEGAYLLFAAPISVSGGDGSPCRAVLVKDIKDI